MGYAYTYDRVGNPLSKTVTQAAGLSELYRYDSAGRLVSFARGTLNGSKSAVAVPSPQDPVQTAFKLDGAGNMVQVGGERRTYRERWHC